MASLLRPLVSRTALNLWLCLAWLTPAGLATLQGAAVAAEEFEFFERRIRPVLVERCYTCHSAGSEVLKGELHLDTREGMRAGGKSGRPAVIPGQPAASRLVEAIGYENVELQMPPKHRLLPEQVEDFVVWIRSGAPDPRTNTRPVQSSGPGPRHWAFQKPLPQQPPTVDGEGWVRTPLDRFILARLERAGLSPSPRVDPRTLLRRATYDLTGLPPTPEEMRTLLTDTSEDAWARVVERLLSSPRYGERWGRYWLDVARYSDTKGYVYDREEKQFVHAHVYRDWVIQAFNDDLPYDRFLMAQVAGDQLIPEGGTMEPRTSPLAGMGFLTVGRRFLGVQHDIIDDRIDVLMRGTQGLTVACARCHDHKFDPISTKDYYALYGVFHSSTERMVSLQPPGGSDPGFEKGLRQREAKLRETFRQKREELTDRLRARAGEYLRAVLDVSNLPSEEFYSIMSAGDLNPVVVRQWDSFVFRRRDHADPIFGPWHAWARVKPEEFAVRSSEVWEGFRRRRQDGGPGVNRRVLDLFSDRPPQSMVEVAERYGRLLSEVDAAWRQTLAAAQTNQTTPPAALPGDLEPIRQILYSPDSPASVPQGAMVDLEWFFDEGTRVELDKLQAEIERWILRAPGAPPYSVILADRSQPKNARVFLRGNPAYPGEEVPRRFLSVLSTGSPHPFTQGSGRLELARAIASPDNPLTARVLVNRVWHHHFGAGLVRTLSDFGTRAEPPSHPELLDWLALRFMNGGWSIKDLHRLILRSAVYQQSSGGTAASWQHDPENRLLGRMHRQRLDFEAMRDSLLAVTGELDCYSGGAPRELFNGTNARQRTVYGYVDRQFVPGVLRIFDFANPDLHIPQRSETTVPQQALFFMNSPFVIAQARALARSLEQPTGQTDVGKIHRLYERVYQRAPTTREVETGRAYVQEAAFEPPPVAPGIDPGPWRYGYGVFDPVRQRVARFTPLPHFTGEAWQGGAQWPDTQLGWVQLTAEGGHAGNDLDHAAIRRWSAPKDAVLSVRGQLRHEYAAGDGISARVVSSQSGVLGSWTLHNGKADTVVERLSVKKGETLDFVVDYGKNLNSDMFKWAPVLTTVDGPDSAEGEWSAERQFSGPPPAPPAPLSAWEKYAQVLLLANEFLFVD